MVGNRNEAYQKRSLSPKTRSKTKQIKVSSTVLDHRRNKRQTHKESERDSERQREPNEIDRKRETDTEATASTFEVRGAHRQDKETMSSSDNTTKKENSSTAAAATTPSSNASQKWSATVNSYMKYFEPSTLVIGRFLLNGMKLQYQTTTTSDGSGQPHKLNVIEAGAGTGGLAYELLTNLSDRGLSIDTFVITDIADGMIEKCQERFKEKLKTNDITNIKIEKADFTNFQHYPDGSFDRYYCNLCLHYAPKEQTNKVIEESYRILRKSNGSGSSGGIAGFTIWGNPQHSPCMTIVPDILHEMNLVEKKPYEDGSFHLGLDDEALKQRFLKVGFTNVTLVHYPGVIESLTPESFVECIIDGSNSTKQQIETYSVERQVEIRKRVYEKAKSILVEKQQPIMLDLIILWAQK